MNSFKNSTQSHALTKALNQCSQDIDYEIQYQSSGILGRVILWIKNVTSHFFYPRGSVQEQIQKIGKLIQNLKTEEFKQHHFTQFESLKSRLEPFNEGNPNNATLQSIKNLAEEHIFPLAETKAQILNVMNTATHKRTIIRTLWENKEELSIGLRLLIPLDKALGTEEEKYDEWLDRINRLPSVVKKGFLKEVRNLLLQQIKSHQHFDQLRTVLLEGDFDPLLKEYLAWHDETGEELLVQFEDDLPLLVSIQRALNQIGESVKV